MGSTLAQTLADGRFRITRVVGEGGMGVVYEAFDREQRGPIALKMMRTPSGDAILRLKNEFRSLRDVRHDNLIRLGELFADGHDCFFTMELVDGVELLDHVWNHQSWPRRARTRTTLAGSGRAPDERTTWDADTLRVEVLFDEPRLRAALRQVAEALAALHQAGKVHRDIKPTNVMVTTGGRVVLLDFGLAVDHGDALTAGSIEGTIEYMAPEQASGEPAESPADVYALGVVLYEALTGRPPFVGEPLAVLSNKRVLDPPPPSALFAGVPPDLDVLCLAMLGRDPARRPSGIEVAAALGDAAQGAGRRPRATAPVPAVAFVGRGDELAELHRAFVASQTRPVAIMVAGESGLGKSTLMRQFAGALRSTGALLFAGRCHAHESVPFRAFDGIADALSRYLIALPPDERAELLPRDVQGLSRLFKVFERLEPPGSEPATGLDVRARRRRAFAALHELLCNLAARGPLALVIDDLQWIDADSLLLFEGVLAARPPPLLLVGMMRPVRKRVDQLRRDLLGLGVEVRELVLPPLSASQCVELARSLLPDDADGVRAAQVAAACQGSPLFLEQLVAGLQSGRDCGGTLEELVWARLTGLDPTALAVLELVCIADVAIDQGTIGRAAALPRAALAAVIARLEAQRLVRTTGARRHDLIEPYHDQVRQATQTRLTSAQLQQRHAALAEVLERRAAPPWFILHHWLAAGEPARAVPHAVEAAVRSQHELSARRVAHLCEVALELLPEDHAAHRQLCRALALALANCGQGVEAAGWYLRAAAQSDGVEGLELRRLAGEHLLRSGRLDQALPVLQGVLAEVGVRLPGSPRRALASLLWRRLRLRWPGRPRKLPVGGSERARLRTDVCLSCGASLAIIDSIAGSALHALGLLEARRLGEPDRLALATAFEVGYAASFGTCGVARTERMIAEATRVGRATTAAVPAATLTWMRGLAAYLRADFRAAVPLLDAAARAFAETCPGHVWEQAQAELFAAFAVSHLGELRELASRVSELERVARWHDDRYTATLAGTGNSVLIALAADQPEHARARITTAMRGWPQVGFHVQHLLALHAETEIDLYLGDGAAAWARLTTAWPVLERSLLLRIQHPRVFTTDLRARAALASGGRAQVDVAERCAARLEREPCPWAAALARARRAGVAGARGQAAAAHAHLAAAADQLAALGVALPAACARLRLAALDGKRLESTPAWHELRDRGVERPDRLMAVYVPWRTLPALGG